MHLHSWHGHWFPFPACAHRRHCKHQSSWAGRRADRLATLYCVWEQYSGIQLNPKSPALIHTHVSGACFFLRTVQLSSSQTVLVLLHRCYWAGLMWWTKLYGTWPDKYSFHCKTVIYCQLFFLKELRCKEARRLSSLWLRRTVFLWHFLKCRHQLRACWE